MTMDAKIELPKMLVVSVLEAIMATTNHAAVGGQTEATSQQKWVLALFEGLGSWHPACAKVGVWHVAVSHVGMAHIDGQSKHVHIPMDLTYKCMRDILCAVYHFTGFLLPSSLVAIVASPPCTTFSKLNARWKTHRDHKQQHKPALSALAKKHDAMVLNLCKSLFPNIENPHRVQGKETIVLSVDKNLIDGEPINVPAAKPASKHCKRQRTQ